MRKSNMRKGFSIIELVIVMGIMVIIMAITANIYANYIEYSNKSICQGQLKDMGVALANYVADYDQNYPSDHWMYKLLTYLPEKDNYICPDADDISYAWNAHLSPIKSPISIYNIRDPFYTIAICDSGENDNYFGLQTGLPYANRNGTMSIIAPCYGNFGIDTIYAGARHNGGVNCLFIDGSVRWIDKSGINNAMIYWQVEP